MPFDHGVTSGFFINSLPMNADIAVIEEELKVDADRTEEIFRGIAHKGRLIGVIERRCDFSSPSSQAYTKRVKRLELSTFSLGS